MDGLHVAWTSRQPKTVDDGENERAAKVMEFLVGETSRL